MDRVSPQQIINLLAQACKDSYSYHASLDLFAPALYAVSWAGEEQSPNWFHIAREYTEKWHHQQQIRLAVGRPGILNQELFYPCIDTFMQALPFKYRDVEARDNVKIFIALEGEITGEWCLIKLASGKWSLQKEFMTDEYSTTIRIPANIVWQMFTKAVDPSSAMAASTVSGDLLLAEPFFNTIAVMG